MNSPFHDITPLIDQGNQALAAYFSSFGAELGTGILALFAVVNSVRVLAYVPQIMCAARDEHGASAISYSTWAMFLASHLTTIAYALVCANDLLMALIFFGNALACSLILGITCAKRRAHRQRWQVQTAG